MRTAAHEAPFVTTEPWRRALQHPQYGTLTTYVRAAAWLRDCATVADWGGGTGAFQSVLPIGTDYTVVDGTAQRAGQILADLTTYHAPSDGILLRHVLDMTEDWATILANAIAAMRQRLVVVTFTPDAVETHVAHVKSGWPVWSFNPDDLRRAMGSALVREEAVRTSHPERVYYLARVAA